jgi:transcription elongation factor Elf1
MGRKQTHGDWKCAGVRILIAKKRADQRDAVQKRSYTLFACPLCGETVSVLTARASGHLSCAVKVHRRRCLALADQ